MTKSEGGHSIRFKDINYGTNKKKIMIALRSSKTHFRSQPPQIVTICRVVSNAMMQKSRLSQQKYCPYDMILEYIRCWGPRSYENELFFIFRDRTQVKAKHFRSVLKKAISDAGIDDDNYNTHCLCIGRMKDLFKDGYTIDKIKEMGRWHSNPVYNYLK